MILGTPRRNLRSLRRLGKLPDLGKRNSAVCRIRRLAWKCTTRRRWTGVIRHPIRNFPSPGVCADVFRGNHPLVIRRGHARAVDPRGEALRIHSIQPGVNVGFLRGKHSSALLLIEKNHRSGRKTLALGRGHRSLRIGFSQPGRARHTLQFRVKVSVEKNEKSKTCGFNRPAVPDPAVSVLAGRIVEPVPGVGEGLMQSF